MDWTTLTTSFVTLFVIIDPLGVTPVFASLTQGMGWGKRIRTAFAGTLIAALILGGFALGGGTLLETVGIGLPAFRTAGGILLFLIGLEMIFEQRTPRRERGAQRTKAELHSSADEDEGIAVFPLAIPLLAGPGAIASIVLLMTAAGDDTAARLGILAALALVILVSFVLLVSASFLLALAGRSAAILITRLMGVLLAALSVQFVFDGIREGILMPASSG